MSPYVSKTRYPRVRLLHTRLIYIAFVSENQKQGYHLIFHNPL